MTGVEYEESKLDFSASNNVMMNGVLLGCHNGLGIEDLEYVTEIISEFIKSNI